jgi:hypothetical protein
MSNLSQIVNNLEAQRRQAQAEVQRLDAALSALRGLGGKGRGAGAGRARRVLSVAARRRIAAAQRARWAAWKAKRNKAA